MRTLAFSAVSSVSTMHTVSWPFLPVPLVNKGLFKRSKASFSKDSWKTPHPFQRTLGKLLAHVTLVFALDEHRVAAEELQLLHLGLKGLTRLKIGAPSKAR